LELLDTLNEKNSALEKKKIKQKEIMAANKLAVSYKPRNVAVGIEKF
jgi:hypothetical protein